MFFYLLEERKLVYGEIGINWIFDGRLLDCGVWMEILFVECWRFVGLFFVERKMDFLDWFFNYWRRLRLRWDFWFGMVCVRFVWIVCYLVRKRDFVCR